MWPREEIVRVLRMRGALCEVAPGVVLLRGDTATLTRALEQTIASLCALETTDEWSVPPAIDFRTLEQAEYFASFPQWLTLVSHLSDDADRLRRVAEHNDIGTPAAPLSDAAVPPKAALNPAVCYHVYARLAGQVVDSPKLVSVQSTCWRHERDRHVPLERQWSFTMRELVCIGSEQAARAFLDRATDRVNDLARALDLDPRVAAATDPFFAPTARAKHLLQRLKQLKKELMLPIGPQARVAASSFNLHDTFFGEAFAIKLPSGAPATTACVAFGIERWLLAFLVRHGPDPVAWPTLDSFAEVHHG
jgi:seryl-tRNA synthetase